MFKAEDIMTDDVVSVRKNMPIYDAIRMMVDNNITGLPVVNDDMTMAGVISEKDVLQLLYNCEDLKEGHSGTVASFMTPNVITFDAEDNLIAVCNCLIKNHFRRVPVLRNKKLVGIITRKDLIKYIIEPITA
ncbi:MAG TPA: CBS domain-containing protein [Sedimentisphaerales bacterium]|nr:CBS domain-containing protein [Sedimentisphaerales bacterium]